MWRLLCFLTLTLLSLSRDRGTAAAATTFSSTEQEHRPQSHFLPESNWMNDPTAPFYDASTGLYHLFYQYLTPRTWGHAVSDNLVDWSILPMALNYSDSPYTEVPGATPGVYTGSALLMTLTSGEVIPWLSVSVPTNDMVLLAYPTDLADPHYTEWTYSATNPAIYSPAPSAAIPPGRDPTEVWQCGLANENKWCLTYATQASEGCPCSGTSGSVVFSATFDGAESEVGAWSAWTLEGYLLNDTQTDPAYAAVMWECTDLFPLVSEENIWLFKYSIGPGPSYTLPWGNPGPRDYYVTGVYKPFETEASGVPASEVSTTEFTPFPEQYAAAMARDERTSLDPGAFYASKSFNVPDVGRVLFGWCPEERPVDSHGNPYGWAGAMSLPRLVVPYQVSGSDVYYVRTPPLESAVLALRDQQHVYSTTMSVSDTAMVNLPQTVGAQLDITTTIGVRGMHDGDICGIRLRSSITDVLANIDTSEGQSSSASDSVVEYTDVYVQFWDCTTPAGGTEEQSECANLTLSVDTTQSTANMSIAVNRSLLTSGSVPYANLALDDHGETEEGGEGGSVQLRALLDHSVVESFLGVGAERAVTRRVYPSSPQEAENVQLFSRCGTGGVACTCEFRATDSWTLRSISTSDSDNDQKSYRVVYFTVIGVVVVFLFVFFGYRARNVHRNKYVDEALLDDDSKRNSEK